MGMFRRSKRHGIAVLLCAAIALTSSVAQAHGARPPELFEQKIKAGLIYNFLKYTTWPDAAMPQGRLRVCLFGDDPFDGYLSPLEGRTAQKAVISIIRINRADEAENCNLVFIHRGQESALAELFALLQDKPVLTVSDIGQFARKGGMIELAKEDDYINMHINRRAAVRAGLGIQDRLLKLAKSVTG